MENQTTVPVGTIPTEPNDRLVALSIGIGVMMVCVSFN